MAGDFCLIAVIRFPIRFNSRPRMAGDGVGDIVLLPAHKFQFTPAHGGRLRLLFRSSGILCFNSRPRMAGDIALQMGARAILFQFTPAHGGRRVLLLCATQGAGFNSRPRMAGDRRKLLVSCDWPPLSGRPTQIVYHFSLRMCARTALPARKSRLPIVKVHL